ncbi:LysR family transcriptional regulator [Phenylobacterium sp.]|uniref:LysR family transcriptional regulator n=1 Tax=Phenylobacterium sp. TaxID=1871053 RepID=UPI0025FB72F3|nr:LysR family transcriptional regulator [Phenylobacterium sp.]
MRNNVSLHTLRLFLRVAETRSFSEASRTENVSQPALSRSIRMLEDQLRVRLFDRDTRNVALTDAGLMLQPIAERLISDYDAAFTDLAQSIAGERGHVTVGVLPSIAAGLLPGVLARFRDERPNVEVKVEDTLSDSLSELLQQRRIDFAIDIEPEADRRLAFQPLLSEEFVLVLRRGDPLDRPGPLPWGELKGQRFIDMAAASSVRRATETAFARADVTRRPLYECAYISTVGGLISAGLGVSALPASTLPMMGSTDVVTRPLINPTVSRTIGIVTLRSRSLSPSAEALVARLCDANWSDAATLNEVLQR